MYNQFDERVQYYSTLPDWRLLSFINNSDNHYSQEVVNIIDDELDSRAPFDTHWHFGDCAGKSVFLPIEEHDSRGYLIASAEKVLAGKIDYDSQGNEVWL